ncbi:MAG: FixG Ig-like domain-containing protein, partial [Pseudomonadota bacterium]
SRWVAVRVQTPPNAATSGSHPIHFTISARGAGGEVEREVVEKSVFLVPR